MRKGQGLLETIVAIGVIVTGLISVMSLVISNLTTQRDTAMRYQAVNLAREGLELVRNMRDSNWLAGQGAWESLTEQGAMVLQFTPGAIASVTELLVDNDQIQQCGDGTYAQNNALCTVSTPFARTLSLRQIPCSGSPDAAFAASTCEAVRDRGLIASAEDIVALEVQSTVTWQAAGQEKLIELSETFYDWR